MINLWYIIIIIIIIIIITHIYNLPYIIVDRMISAIILFILMIRQAAAS